MPSDFVGRRQPSQRKTLADLLRELQSSPGVSRPPMSTTPVAGPGRLRQQKKTAARNQETELERRRRAAEEALKRLKG